MRDILFIYQKLVKAYRLYNGSDPLTDLPRISGRFYIARPKKYMKRSNRTKQVNYIEIIAQLPQSRPTEPPEYLAIISYRSFSKMRPRDLKRVMTFISKRIKKIGYGPRIHIFIYIYPEKATQGVYEEIKKIYGRARQNGLNMMIKIADPGTAINDLKKYLEARLNGLLKKPKYVKTQYRVFGYPKRMIEYFLILNALLHGLENMAIQIAMISHNHARVPLDTYVKTLNEILYNNKEEEIRTNKEIRTLINPNPYI